ncbi:hypothetical protein BZA05DRAFT_202857 [Tricharina praecox]|uniref:uncharacterized protein n=1 Tax=Tricharina praecox TaxID=43433 RepID=UPI00221ECC67|nr:uncharacterized protein BZA05DRAFT_202857 [Tricharina praecox]KAI5856499.1 hypothetical protein BZA05DRAFT_202857 [Tricharina praecox]
MVTAHCPLPTAHCPLPTAHCPLPTAHCPLSTAHCPLQPSALTLTLTLSPAGKRHRAGSTFRLVGLAGGFV